MRRPIAPRSPGNRVRRSLRRLLAGLAAAAALGSPAAAGAGPREFTFPSANRLYPDLAAAAAPVSWGPLTVRLASPKAAVRVTAHRLRLTPLPDGTYRVWGEATFSAAGTAVAEIEAGGMTHRQTDDLLLPRQTREAEGRVRISLAQGAYWVTAIESPPSVELHLRSGLARDLVAWCEGAPLLALVGAECRGLERPLTHATVPLPPPGTTYRIPFAELAPADREELDRYLAANRPR